VNQKDKEALSYVLDPSYIWRALFAEGWGTFLLVLVGAGAEVDAEMIGQVSKAMAVVTSGLMVMVTIYFMGAISGAHINPAVTLAFACRRHFPWKRVPGYILAQLLGGVLAAVFLKSIGGI
jgi:aquaporin Z